MNSGGYRYYMILCYSVAKEAKYKKNEHGHYIKCVFGIQVDGEEPKTEKERIAKAYEMRKWVSEQINVNMFFMVPITKEKYDAEDYDSEKGSNIHG